LFLITIGKDATPLHRNTGTVRIEAIADYVLSVENGMCPDFTQYSVHCTDANVLWLFGWRFASVNTFHSQVVAISNEGVSGAIELGSTRLDSVSVNGNGELEILEYRKEYDASRTTIRNGKAETVPVTTIQRLHTPGWRALDSSMQRITINRQLQPTKSNYFKASRECRAAIDVSTCASRGITWLLTSDGVFGVRDDVLQHLHSYEDLIPMNFTVEHDTTHMRITAILPWTERFRDVVVKLVDDSGATVAEKRLRASSDDHATFSTKQLKKGIYSVIASSVSMRGVRTLRLR
jgi:hypothetical protein